MIQIKDIDPLLVEKESFMTSLTSTYKVEKEDSLYILKMGGKWRRDHLIHERKVLLVAREIDGITHLIKTYWIKNPSLFRRDIALLKEYFDGSTLWKSRLDGRIEANKLQKKLEGIVKELHSIGIADLDLHSGNIVVSPDQQEIKIIDLGQCKYFNIFRGTKFERYKSRDLRHLESLFG